MKMEHYCQVPFQNTNRTYHFVTYNNIMKRYKNIIRH